MQETAQEEMARPRVGQDSSKKNNGPSWRTEPQAGRYTDTRRQAALQTSPKFFLERRAEAPLCAVLRAAHKHWMGQREDLKD